MKKVLFAISILFAITSVYGQGTINVKKYTKAGLDPITYEKIEVPAQEPREIVLQQLLTNVGNTPYIDINGKVYYFSQETWNGLKASLNQALMDVYNAEKSKPANRQKRRDNARAIRVQEQAIKQRQIDKLIQEKNAIDGLSGEDLP